MNALVGQEAKANFSLVWWACRPIRAAFLQ